MRRVAIAGCAIVLIAIAACRTTQPKAKPEEPVARSVPVELEWPDAGVP